MSAERVTYLDSSAIVKLVVKERESDALRQFLQRQQTLVSSALARTEVCRAVVPLGDRYVKRAHEVLARIELIRVNDRLLRLAGTLEPHGLRTLDAIHLASASLLELSLTHFVCYDERLSAAAADQGWIVADPA